MGIMMYRSLFLIAISTTRLDYRVDIRTSTAAAVERSMVGCFTNERDNLGILQRTLVLPECLSSESYRCIRATLIDIRLRSEVAAGST